VGVAKTWRYVRNSPVDFGPQKGSNRSAFTLGASTGLVAILIHSVMDFNMHIPANAILAVTLMALLSGSLRFSSERYWVRLGIGLKCFASVVFCAGMVYLALQGGRRGREDYWLERAASKSPFSKPHIDDLSRAFAVEPMNPETAYGIGEALRVQSNEGPADAMALADKGRQWFERCIKLNPWDSRGFLGCGMCMDYLGRHAESAPFFSRAEQLDPNGYFTLANIGMHYVALSEYNAARPWFERSLRLQRSDNPIALSYLDLCNARLLEAATNDFSARLLFVPK
jgi:tetratricopeptide (TPR) repeat protein